jgi:rhodanese-related sulfurtransferase
MRVTKWASLTCMFFLTLMLVRVSNGDNTAFTREVVNQKVVQPEFVTAEELKTKLSRSEPVTVIDVRSANGLESDNKIKGAYYVKLRRLKYRLGFPPLKDVPRDREVITYCACPNDESSVRAAQILRDSGFKRVRVLKGGWLVWKKANGPMERMARG